MALLAALAEYGTWHSLAFLQGRALLPPDLTAAQFTQAGTALTEAGCARARYSDLTGRGKGWMFKITLDGRERLREQATGRTT
jgi:hypothetical protein